MKAELRPAGTGGPSPTAELGASWLRVEDGHPSPSWQEGVGGAGLGGELF